MLDRLLPVAVLVAAGFYLLQALALPLGTAARPGAGFYPVAVGLFACLVALAATVRGFFGPPAVARAPMGDAEVPGQRRRVAMTTAALAGFCLAMPWTGYPVVAAAFVITTLRALGSRWWTALAIGVLSALGSHYLFAVLLDVPLPRGPW